TAPTDLYPPSLHDALPIYAGTGLVTDDIQQAKLEHLPQSREGLGLKHVAGTVAQCRRHPGRIQWIEMAFGQGFGVRPVRAQLVDQRQQQLGALAPLLTAEVQIAAQQEEAVAQGGQGSI